MKTYDPTIDQITFRKAGNGDRLVDLGDTVIRVERRRGGGWYLNSDCFLTLTDVRVTIAQVAGRMFAAGFVPYPTGGGCQTWSKDLGDNTALWICTKDNNLVGDPEKPEWLVGRQDMRESGYVEIKDAVTLAEALRIAPLIPSPNRDGCGPVQISISVPR